MLSFPLTIGFASYFVMDRCFGIRFAKSLWLNIIYKSASNFTKLIWVPE